MVLLASVLVGLILLLICASFAPNSWNLPNEINGLLSCGVPLVLLVLGGLAFGLSWVYRRAPNLRGGGIPTSIGILRGQTPFRWLTSLVGMFGLSLISFVVGLPLGNEGPSVQIGTAVGLGSAALSKKSAYWSIRAGVPSSLVRQKGTTSASGVVVIRVPMAPVSLRFCQ